VRKRSLPDSIMEFRGRVFSTVLRILDVPVQIRVRIPAVMNEISMIFFSPSTQILGHCLKVDQEFFLSSIFIRAKVILHFIAI